MFCEENLGKINAKDVEKFFRNGYVHEFYRLKAFITLLGSLVECGKLSLYAYESRDKHDRWCGERALALEVAQAFPLSCRHISQFNVLSADFTCQVPVQRLISSVPIIKELCTANNFHYAMI